MTASSNHAGLYRPPPPSPVQQAAYQRAKRAQAEAYRQGSVGEPLSGDAKMFAEMPGTWGVNAVREAYERGLAEIDKTARSAV